VCGLLIDQFELKIASAHLSYRDYSNIRNGGGTIVRSRGHCIWWPMLSLKRGLAWCKNKHWLSRLVGLSSLWGRNVSTFILLRVFRLIRMSCWTGKNVADMVQYDVLHRSWHRFVGVCCGVYFRYVRPFKRGIAVLQCSQPAATFGESVLSHNGFRKKSVDTKNFALS